MMTTKITKKKKIMNWRIAPKHIDARLTGRMVGAFLRTVMAVYAIAVGVGVNFSLARCLG